MMCSVLVGMRLICCDTRYRVSLLIVGVIIEQWKNGGIVTSYKINMVGCFVVC